MCSSMRRSRVSQSSRLSQCPWRDGCFAENRIILHRKLFRCLLCDEAFKRRTWCQIVKHFNYRQSKLGDLKASNATHISSIIILPEENYEEEEQNPDARSEQGDKSLWTGYREMGIFEDLD
ncbi:hypothetical protein M422DRAFT_54211 [Sphaerobolus stellatus SS14]|uniref:Uncharacterized protein n=1 Tax=Sphaerobolus stellatus (strain SS14) TaxID=990650 RepID=A0A0C9UKH0_SPHS4|nr:hypothetical protein M422DRAFT_54211 [Sphaerobolus stellatus SS14]